MSLTLRFWAKLCARSLAYFILVWHTEVSALPDDASKPIDISADAVEIDEAQHTSIYIGKVEMQQGSMHLWGDHVTVYHQASRQPEKIVAIGKPARYEQTEQEGDVIHAEGLRMDYNVLKDEVWLTDKASFKRGKDSFNSDRIFYDRKSGIVKGGASAQGRQRVYISIFPNSGTTKPKPVAVDVTPAKISAVPSSKTTNDKLEEDIKPISEKTDLPSARKNTTNTNTNTDVNTGTKVTSDATNEEPAIAKSSKRKRRSKTTSK